MNCLPVLKSYHTITERMITMDRSSGILMPMSSLPSPFGIGTMGQSAYNFIDFLKAAGQSYWQLLPLCPTSCGNSPYSSFSGFAGNPYYIDLELLIQDGLLNCDEVNGINWGEDMSCADYERIAEHRLSVLRLAFERGRIKYAREIESFCRENARWLDNYALFMALKEHFGGTGWICWPEDIRLRRPEAVEKYSKALHEEAEFHSFLQFLFFRQWEALRAYARENGISFIGDMPIYMSLDSADVWSEPEFFLLDENNMPTLVAGVPPDYFAQEGQLWGNPLFDWDAMKKDGYGWWIRRIDGARRLYDIIRIDHFRGFDSYWAVPAEETTAINGHWMPGPGMGLVGVLTSWFYGLQFIAEDLGCADGGVQQLLEDSGLPGMKVLQFAFESDGNSSHLPHNAKRNSVCFVGTHDNNTVKGWLEESRPEDVEFARSYMHITEDEGWCWGFIRTGMASVSELFVVAMQDVLELGAECRMNVPGVAEGNWRWRMEPDAITPELAEKLREYTVTYRRA